MVPLTMAYEKPDKRERGAKNIFNCMEEAKDTLEVTKRGRKEHVLIVAVDAWSILVLLPRLFLYCCDICLGS